tara:strand:- start:12571 stop:13122 length:552 start_codon:yes stop_codon:yes gene_type:complete
MGYTTNFTGLMALSRRLTQDELDEYNQVWLNDRHDTTGEYSGDYRGGLEKAPSIYNKWEIIDDVEHGITDIHCLAWNGGQKFYQYVNWLKFIVSDFLQPKGIYLKGKIRFSGEDVEDAGVITAHLQTIRVRNGEEKEWIEEKSTIIKVYRAFDVLDKTLEVYGDIFSIEQGEGNAKRVRVINN